MERGLWRCSCRRCTRKATGGCSDSSTRSASPIASSNACSARALTDEDRAFIERLDLFFLATVNSRGEPSCSYKGGDPGFVRVLDPTHARVPVLRRQRHVSVDGQRGRERPRRNAVHRPLLAEAAARERHGAHRAARVRHAAFPRSAVRRRRRAFARCFRTARATFTSTRSSSVRSSCRTKAP